MLIHYNLVQGRASIDLEPINEDWQVFVDGMSTPSVRQQKDGPGIVPGRFKPGGKRKIADAVSHTLVVLDLDNKGNELTKQRIMQALQGYVYAAHTTHSSTNANPKWRVILPIKEELSQDQYERVYAYFGAVFGESMDGSCFDLARLFYLPSCKELESYDAWSSEGETFSLDCLPGVLPDRDRTSRDRPARGVALQSGAQSPGSAPLILDQIAAGSIDNTFVSIAGLLWGYGCDETDIKACLESMSKRTEVPVSANHIKDVINTIKRYTRGQRNLQVHDFSLNHAIISVDGDTRILKEDWDPVLNQPKVTLFSMSSFQAFYAYRKEDAIAWLLSPLSRRYDGFVFDPEHEHDGRYNLWKGFAVEPISGSNHQRYLDHIYNNICAGDDQLYFWVVTWLAEIVQHPGQLSGTSLVLRGEEGTGKGAMLRNFGTLFGQHYKHITNRQNIVGNFNSMLSDAVFVYADEALYAGDRQMEGRLKGLITEPTLTIELKGINPFVVKNCVHLAMSSNHERVVPAGVDARRWAVLDVGAGKQRDKEYFEAIQDDLNFNGGLSHLLAFFHDWDCSVANTNIVPETAALKSQKILSLERNIEHFVNFLAGATDNTKYYKMDLYKNYQDFARDVWLTPTRYWMALMRYIKKGEDYDIKRDSLGEYVIFGTTGTNTVAIVQEKFARRMRMTWDELRQTLNISDIVGVVEKVKNVNHNIF